MEERRRELMDAGDPVKPPAGRRPATPARERACNAYREKVAEAAFRARTSAANRTAGTAGGGGGSAREVPPSAAREEWTQSSIKSFLFVPTAARGGD